MGWAAIPFQCETNCHPWCKYVRGCQESRLARMRCPGSSLIQDDQCSTPAYRRAIFRRKGRMLSQLKDYCGPILTSVPWRKTGCIDYWLLNDWGTFPCLIDSCLSMQGNMLRGEIHCKFKNKLGAVHNCKLQQEVSTSAGPSSWQLFQFKSNRVL